MGQPVQLKLHAPGPVRDSVSKLMWRSCPKRGIEITKIVIVWGMIEEDT